MNYARPALPVTFWFLNVAIVTFNLNQSLRKTQRMNPTLSKDVLLLLQMLQHFLLCCKIGLWFYYWLQRAISNFDLS